MKRNRLQTVGIVLTVIGLLFMVAAGVAYSKVQDGYSALDAFALRRTSPFPTTMRAS